jgi:ABC-type transport system involved in cytochrome c biogenesis permease subunit
MLGAISAFISLLITMTRYSIGRFMAVYIFFLFISMVLLMFTQFYAITVGFEPNWKFKTVSVFWWVKALYFSWAIRFSSLKK